MHQKLHEYLKYIPRRNKEKGHNHLQHKNLLLNILCMHHACFSRRCGKKFAGNVKMRSQTIIGANLFPIDSEGSFSWSRQKIRRIGTILHTKQDRPFCSLHTEINLYFFATQKRSIKNAQQQQQPHNSTPARCSKKKRKNAHRKCLVCHKLTTFIKLKTIKT